MISRVRRLSTWKLRDLKLKGRKSREKRQKGEQLKNWRLKELLLRSKKKSKTKKDKLMSSLQRRMQKLRLRRRSWPLRLLNLWNFLLRKFRKRRQRKLKLRVLKLVRKLRLKPELLQKPNLLLRKP